ncbi:MAG: T9SS type A sorting domain-containing protein, partial [Bacteroidales bacterium]|nr:T9SS type A sorting domain-containing protein [Bacteroidales bacterium]
PAVPVTVIDTTICHGEIFTLHGITAGVSGTYRDTLQNIFGCDSIVEVSLVVRPAVPVTVIDTTICHGEIFTLHGITASVSGTYLDTLQNIFGCDSIVILNLTVNQQIDTVIFATITLGDTYTENGFNLSEAGTYHYTLQNIFGCDSIVTLHLETVTGIINRHLATIKIYPNPAKNELRIENAELKIGETVHIFDISGRAVETWHATSLQNGTATINVSRLPSGVYFLRIGDKTARFVKE